jgi:hypothetical protein
MSSSPIHVAATALLMSVNAVLALDNGLGLVPQMGYSSWNDCGSVVTEDHMKARGSHSPPGRGVDGCFHHWLFFSPCGWLA